MRDNEELIQLISQSEFLLEGLDKGFWRFVKLSEPEIWNNAVGNELKSVWVVAIMGNHCITYDRINNSEFFRLGCYETYGEIKKYLPYQDELHYLISEILSSRYVIS